VAATVHPLVEQVLAGGNRQLQELAAAGLLPLAPDHLIPLQVTFARSRDADLAARATASLRTLEPRVAAAFLERDAGAEELAFFAREVAHPLVIETILRRRDVPRGVLVGLARRLPAEQQEILLLRQDAILDEPAILAALEENGQLTPYAQRRIVEYRQHLLPQRSGAPRAPAAVPAPPPEEGEADDLEVAQALAAARRLARDGEAEEHTGLSEAQIRQLPVQVRIRLSRGASRLMRSILVRDQSAPVALSVLRNNTFTESEMEHVARSRQVLEDVLLAVARRREWVGKYPVVKALVQNPRTPVALSVRLIPRLSVRDLREVSRDRNVPDAVRSMATRLYRIKQK
jgi:hypothetical protein